MFPSLEASKGLKKNTMGKGKSHCFSLIRGISATLTQLTLWHNCRHRHTQVVSIRQLRHLSLKCMRAINRGVPSYLGRSSGVTSLPILNVVFDLEIGPRKPSLPVIPDTYLRRKTSTLVAGYLVQWMF